MYETANPPHFLQMHKGELSQVAIDEFNRAYDGMEHWQTVPLINFYGDDITVSKESGKQFTLSDCRLDISFMRQNDRYDVLLDSERNKLEVGTGEIAVPVILLDEFDISVGDRITLTGDGMAKTFTVSSYAYDGQMNSTLCSSTRFLISDTDFSELSGSTGETEYLIEAWLTDSSQAAAYQTAYEQSGRNLPKNGQAITYTVIFLLSALTDLLTAMVFLLTGVLLVVIALSYLMADELEKTVGDSITILTDGETRKLTVCGIYQDVTSGGRTAKTRCAFPRETAEKYSYGIALSSGINADALAVSLREQLGSGYSIENMEEFLRQTLGGVSAQIQQASYAVLFIGICLTVLITALFLKLRMAREVAALTAKKAMGIPFTAILLQELYPVLLAGGFGFVCGVLLAELFGDNLISGLFGVLGMGLKKIVFAESSAWQLFVIPALLLVTLSAVTVSICTGIKYMDVASHINE